jgi:hypothetical protein
MPDDAAAPTIEIAPDLAERAKAAGWPEDLVAMLLGRGAQPSDLTRYMSMGVTAEQVRGFIAQQDAAAASGGGPGMPGTQLDLSWMNVPTEWGTRAMPTKKGLTLEAINIGRYGEIPDVWEFKTEMPRGAVAVAGVEAMGYTIYEKQELWSDNAAALYEEAIQRRWRPATDIVWDSLQPLPDDLERAICQICTHFSEKVQLEADVIAGWEPELSYGYHEVKLYLATVVFEGARHAEVFRKRALANGGGLGIQSTGWSFRSVTDARNFTEFIGIQMVLQDSFTLTQYAHCEAFAPHAAEKLLFRLAMQDKARHLAYGIAHLKYVLLHRPERRLELQRYLDKGETMLCWDDKDTATREAFAVLFAGGKDNIQQGLQMYDIMRGRQVHDYLARLNWATLDRSKHLTPALRPYLPAEEAAPVPA